MHHAVRPNMHLRQEAMHLVIFIFVESSEMSSIHFAKNSGGRVGGRYSVSEAFLHRSITDS